MLGMFGFIDPPREEAIKAVETCGSAGIRVKMITGDHGTTALSIARQTEARQYHDVLTGQELESMSDDELRKRVRDIDVYARVRSGTQVPPGEAAAGPGSDRGHDRRWCE